MTTSATYDILALRYKPIVYLHSDERYFPSSVDYYMANSGLVAPDGTKTNAPTTNAQLAALPDGGKGYHMQPADSKLKYGQGTLAPIYYHVYEAATGEFYITYMFYFPYSAPFYIALAWPEGEHWGDVEHVTVQFDKDGNKVGCFYSIHSDGKLISTGDDRDLVYCAKYSHAVYPSTGVKYRLYGVANDLCDAGVLWDGELRRVYSKDEPGYDESTMGFMAYDQGDMGPDGIKIFSERTWYKNPSSEISTTIPPTIMYNWRNDWYVFSLLIILIGVFVVFFAWRIRLWDSVNYKVLGSVDSTKSR